MQFGIKIFQSVGKITKRGVPEREESEAALSRALLRRASRERPPGPRALTPTVCQVLCLGSRGLPSPSHNPGSVLPPHCEEESTEAQTGQVTCLGSVRDLNVY